MLSRIGNNVVSLLGSYERITLFSWAKVGSFSDMFWVHLKKNWIVWILFFLCLVMLSENYKITWNLHPSLPHKLYLIHKNEPVQKGQIAAFLLDVPAFHEKRATFIKYIRGIEGDVVTQVDRRFYVNGEYIGTAKTHSLKGEPLEMMETPYTLKKDEFFMAGVHKDSLDSKYKMFGIVKHDKFVGRAKEMVGVCVLGYCL